MAGAFDLSRPSDLLAKLQRELDRLRQQPENGDHAFNLFVTAEHMLDWLHPGQDPTARQARETLRSSDPLVELAAHLANGSKHFDKLSSRHRSVKATERRGGWFAPSYNPRGWFGRGYFAEERLVVSLDGAAEARYGSEATALFLAEEVVKYWSVPGRVPS